MSLLKNILRRNSEQSGYDAPKTLTSRRGMKEYEASVKSSTSTLRSVASIAESVASFYSMMTGGSKIPKRRRAPISKLGAPKVTRRVLCVTRKPRVD
jgi:hypothetical protein